MQNQYDLIIVGAGLAGNCLALALKDTGMRIALVESSSRQQLATAAGGDRALALAAGTVKLLETLGAWSAIAEKATAIKHIHVSDRGHFGKTRLSAQQQGVAALGYVIVARDIETHVADLVAQTGIDVFYETRVAGVMSGFDEVNVSLKQHGESLNISAQLLVGADGGQSTVRKLLEIPQSISDYGQTALVTTVKATRPHQNTAYERFTSFGPLALLPLHGKHLSVVWTRSHEQAEGLLHGSEADFLAELQDCFGYRLGTLTLTEPRRAFPLSLIRAEQMVAGRVVIIGNAAHQLHPVAGQGFNLGIRDVAYLAELLNSHQQKQGDLGATELLNLYAKQRQADHNKTIGFTDNLVNLFSNDWLPVAALRNTGLTLLDHLPAVKKILVKHAMGMAAGLSKLHVD
ncbi:2-octaprenyl-6-methoxyphenyl hydroxylase [Methylomonas sp. AM2-LC]|uniref:2-octaprenyl-6-methoxyphenyl hydroxylase n=1 Tax=Methylomonas sp. AM2-LC TaxID=3153301 RepID=UPI0032674AFF